MRWRHFFQFRQMIDTGTLPGALRWLKESAQQKTRMSSTGFHEGQAMVRNRRVQNFCSVGAA
jgi:hypothetical protein